MAALLSFLAIRSVAAVIHHQPDWVIRVSVQHAERLMVEVKSKNYPLAAAWLKRTKAAYQKLGQGVEWQR